MHQAVEHGSKFSLSAALKACARNGNLTEGRLLHDQVIRSGHDSNAVVGTSIVDMYAKCGSFGEACRTFDTYPHRDLVSWNAFISACIDHNSCSLVLDCFRNMQQVAGFSPNKVSFGLALKACGVENMLWQGRLVHEHIIRCGIVIDETCGSSLIDMYAKCGDLDDAQTLFMTLPYKNVFAWGALMAGYVQHGQGAAVLELFEEMESKAIRPSAAIYSCVLKACGSLKHLEKGKLVHDQIMDHGLGSDQIINNALMDMYAKCGDFEEAFKVLDKLPHQNEWSWGAIIGGYMQRGCSLLALEVFEKMQKRGVKPNKVIYSCVLKACGDIGATDEGRVLHQWIIVDSVESNEEVYNSLIGMYASFGSLAEAWKIFNTISKANARSYDAMIVGYSRHGHSASLLELFEKVQRNGIKPSEAMFSCAVKACGGLKALIYGRSIHGQIVVNLAKPDVVLVNSLIDMYLSCGSLKEAEKVFDKSITRDVVSWNSILSGYTQNGHPSSALKVFNKMLKSDLKPDRVTFLCMVKACSSVGALREGRFMHDKILEGGFEADVAVRVSLVDMFARCGSLLEAEKLLSGAAKCDTGAWAALIAGYAQHGECKVARERFHDMQMHGVMPDIAAFTVILTSCCHAGEVEEGYWFFNAMKKEYGITPKLEHFNCLIDLLGRAGRLSEASQLFKIMPDFPDVMGWMSLLTACKRYGDAELGKECVEEILRIDPQNSAVFTLMSNTFADGHMWEDAAGLEKLRSYANAWKKPATAWIQIEDQIHEFTLEKRAKAEDDLNSARLKFLKKQMEKAGYIPKLDIVTMEKTKDESDSFLKLNNGDEHAFNSFEESGHAEAHALVGFGHVKPLKGATVRLARVFYLSASQKLEKFSTPKTNRKEIVLRNSYGIHFSSSHFVRSYCLF
ncbi:hypothetical protein GOP47_0005772 [Adiantum capillus-veneris]|uniref:Pentatricopeptide repeat-containing protein n=1 Tax=Adiantum capillus-veneris TaxID=13818 RepID=A0A9D4V607_ADICA|nr:hypothetical protein GOP47_0005772 [Adiantum capillus-veneris]